MPQWTEVTEIDIKWRLRSGFGVVIEEVRNIKLDGIVGWPIDRSYEECRKGGDRHFRNRVILAEGIKESVLEFGYARQYPGIRQDLSLTYSHNRPTKIIVDFIRNDADTILQFIPHPWRREKQGMGASLG